MNESPQSPQRARVIESHVSSPQSPVEFVTGDILGVGHRDRQWTTYVWVTDQSGHAGWVPDSYLEMTSEHEAVAVRDYDATELTIVKDEIVEVLEETGGWVHCRNSGGIDGWVPTSKVQLLTED
jgi:SH3-like domain-containing protein